MLPTPTDAHQYSPEYPAARVSSDTYSVLTLFGQRSRLGDNLLEIIIDLSPRTGA